MLLVADVLLLLTFTAILLLCTYLRRRGDMGAQPQKRTTFTVAGALLLACLAASFTSYGIDVTEEQLHTPDVGVKRILGDIPHVPVTYTLYLSSDHPGLGNRQRLFVDQLKFYLTGLARHLPNVTFELRNPTTSLEAEMEARRLYLEPTQDARG